MKLPPSASPPGAEAESAPQAAQPELPLLSWAGLWLLVVCVPVVVLGIWWNGLFALAQAAAAASW
ncbi:MAG TPA: hypothetical protein PK777_17160 [Thermoguttaceae bacterium]|nr:hypothetical protein [Thermoguttaceae bacterium]